MNNEHTIHVHIGNIVIIRRIYKLFGIQHTAINNIKLSNNKILRPISGVTFSSPSDELLDYTPSKEDPTFRVVSLGSMTIYTTTECPYPAECAWLPADFFKIVATK